MNVVIARFGFVNKSILIGSAVSICFDDMNLNFTQVPNKLMPLEPMFFLSQSQHQTKVKKNICKNKNHSRTVYFSFFMRSFIFTSLLPFVSFTHFSICEYHRCVIYALLHNFHTTTNSHNNYRIDSEQYRDYETVFVIPGTSHMKNRKKYSTI